MAGIDENTFTGHSARSAATFATG